MDESPDHEAYPYRMGHGRPLELLANSSMRNPQSATRSMGVAETSPSVPRRDGEGTFKTRRRAHPDRLEWAQARGLDAWLHLLGCTGREWCQSRVRHRSRLKHCRRRLEHVPRPLTIFRGKTLQEHPRSCRASGARPAGPLTWPHGRHLQPGGKDVLSVGFSICGSLAGIPADARGLLLGTALRVP
jgi:hypothetical protein